MENSEKDPKERYADWHAAEAERESVEGRERLNLDASIHTIASRQHPERNEDAAMGVEEAYTYAVFDGVGGHGHGEVASTLARNVIRQKINEMLVAEKDAVLTMSTIAEFMRDAILEANQKIVDENNRRDSNMATTASMVKIVPSFRGEPAKLLFVNVGDSRVYIMRGGRLHQMSTDDVWVRDENLRKKFRRIKNPDTELAPEERILYANRYAITRSLGMESLNDVQVNYVDLIPGDTILLCTDGLSDNFDTDEEMVKLLQKSRSSLEAVHFLVDQAKNGPKADDVTGAVIRLKV